MKIVTLAEFVRLPEGVIFSFWAPCIADGLHQKCKTIAYNGDPDPPRDFYYVNLLPTAIDPDDGVELNDLMCRWGMYDHDQLFAVYEADDLDILKKAIAEAGKVL